MPRYQTSSSTVANYNSNSDNRLDELLEDLQSTVSPSRPLLNGPSTGYREVYKSVQTQSTGKPAESSSEYKFEYLTPSNSTALVQEQRTKSPYYDKENYNEKVSGQNVSSYKTVAYEYNTKSSNSEQVIPSTERSEAKFRQNINELDSLLDDLNHTQKTEYSSTSSNQSNRLKSYDSGFLEPIDSSTPQKKSHVSRIEERRYEEQRYGSGNTTSPPVISSEVKKEVLYNGEPVERYVDRQYSGSTDHKKDLVFTGGNLRHREPSPGRQLQQVYHYETKTSSTKSSTEPQSVNNLQRSYRTDTDVTDNAVPFNTDNSAFNAYNYNRSPSPASRTAYYTSSNVREVNHRSVSPPRSYVRPSPQPSIKSIHSRTVHETSTRSPPTPPHRSPSPVSFAQPPDPQDTAVRSYSLERNNQSPQFRQKFSPSDPSREPAGQAVITRNYKYSSQSTQNSRYPQENRREPSPPARFPSAPSPLQPEEQKPPKQLDELLASFSDTETHRRDVYNKYNTSRSSPATPRCPSTPEKLKVATPPPTDIKYTLSPADIKEHKSNGVAGPAVYYPSGPLFTKKEESAAMMEQSYGGKGEMKAKRKAMYKYESGSKMKESSSTKTTVVPCCCPLGCAMPCVIM